GIGGGRGSAGEARRRAAAVRPGKALRQCAHGRRAQPGGKDSGGRRSHPLKTAYPLRLRKYSTWNFRTFASWHLRSGQNTCEWSFRETKKRSSQAIGCSAASSDACPGLAMGPGGRHLMTYVLYGCATVRSVLWMLWSHL